MNDFISRQEALNALGEVPKAEAPGSYKSALEWGETLQWVKDREAIMNVPAVQPGSKKGKWIYGKNEYGIGGYYCDKCGFFVPLGLNVDKFINFIEDYNYCPSCGAITRGERGNERIHKN